MNNHGGQLGFPFCGEKLGLLSSGTVLRHHGRRGGQWIGVSLIRDREDMAFSGRDGKFGDIKKSCVGGLYDLLVGEGDLQRM